MPVRDSSFVQTDTASDPTVTTVVIIPSASLSAFWLARSVVVSALGSLSVISTITSLLTAPVSSLSFSAVLQLPRALAKFVSSEELEEA